MQIFNLIFIIDFLVFSISGFSQSAKIPITVEDFFNVKTVGDPRISPDGEWVAYTVWKTDLKEDKKDKSIWMISIIGGEPMRMTAQGYSASNPRWSPDGKYLSFTASKEKGQKTQVWALNRLGGEAQQLTNVKQGVSGYEWSPDGTRLLLSIRDQKPQLLNDDPEDDHKPQPHVIDRLQFKLDGVGYLDRRRRHYYVYEIGSEKEPVQITSGDYDDSQGVWSPDGESIAFVSNRTKNPDSNRNTDIWIVPANNVDKGKKVIQLTTNPNRDRYPSWNPDGKSIVYNTVTASEKVWSGIWEVAIVSATGGTPTLLTPNLDRNTYDPEFSADGESIWFMLEDEGEEQLSKMDIASQNIERKVTGETIVWEYHLKGNQLITLSTRYNLPYEIFKLENNRLKQLTFTNKKVLDELEFSIPQKIKFKSTDGTPIEGYLYKPIGYVESKKYPTILWLHGGPAQQYNAIYSHRPQYFAANGYLVLHINPRGSSGYGQAFTDAIWKDPGNLDYEDVIAGVDYAIEQGYADADKLGVGGWSYGGILTNYVITKTGRFKAAISGASIGLFRANYGTDYYQIGWETEFGLPWEYKEVWEELSPYNYVEKITTPTLWIGGEDDWKTPISNSEQMYMAMKRLGKETQLVVYPDESHWPMSRPSFEIDRAERYLGWFDKYVKGKTE